MFKPLKIQNMTLRNRVVLPPMCMYQAKDDGYVDPFHIIHYGTRAMGGVALVIQESTGITPNGRITTHDLGIWHDGHIEGLKRIVEAIHLGGALAGIQLNHAGRKANVDDVVAPSALPFGDKKMPRALSIDEINEVVLQFKAAAIRANQAGYDVLEIHAAHGYLINQFISPLSNHRQDRYQDGVLFLEEIFAGIEEVWPTEKLISLRISAEEYVPEGLHPLDWVKIMTRLKKYKIDIIHVSSGGISPITIHDYPGYQLDFAKTIKRMTDKYVIGGGLITDETMINYTLNEGIDMVYLGRKLLRDPYYLIKINQQLLPKNYERAKVNQ